MSAPSHLIELQEKFAKVLLGKLPLNSIRPKERMEVYYSAYLARFSGVLGRQFPTLLLLLGEKVFQEKVAWPYLRKKRIKDWQLDTFGLGLTEWMKREMLGLLSPLLLPIAEIDEAFLLCAFPREREGFLKKEIQVVESLYPLIDLRKALHQRTPLPTYEKKKRGFVIYSDEEGKQFSREIDAFEGKLLKLLTTHPLESALTLLVQDHTLPLNSLESLLPLWSSRWGELKWIQESGLF